MNVPARLVLLYAAGGVVFVALLVAVALVQRRVHRVRRQVARAMLSEHPAIIQVRNSLSDRERRELQRRFTSDAVARAYGVSPVVLGEPMRVDTVNMEDAQRERDNWLRDRMLEVRERIIAGGSTWTPITDADGKPYGDLFVPAGARPECVEAVLDAEGIGELYHRLLHDEPRAGNRPPFRAPVDNRDYDAEREHERRQRRQADHARTHSTPSKAAHRKRFRR